MDPKDLKQFIKNARACVPIFIALGDESRQKLFIDIANAGSEGINVTNLTENSHLSRPAISYHLKMLKSSGIVKCVKKGTQIFYYTDPTSKNTKIFKETISFFDSMMKQI